MLAEERRHRVMELVRLRGGFASLPELKSELDVSESTIRRDLEFLEQTGAARRTRGGVYYTGATPTEPYSLGEPTAWDKKQAIARRAAELIDNGDTLLLDGGSTTYELARVLVGRPVQVFTNSLLVANLFAADAYANLRLIGGYVYPRTGVTLGPFATKMLADVRVRKTILSVAGITADGFFNDNELLVEAERAMLKAADEVIIVADSTKLGHLGLVHLCGLGDVNQLVVDAGISDDWRQKLLEAGVDLVVAGDATDEESAQHPEETAR